MGDPVHGDFDPFLLEILKSSFDTIADDMALNLMRTAYSGIVRDSMDFSTAILDTAARRWPRASPRRCILVPSTMPCPD
jgi:N-methylhydantoinase B/oxoprolinase/acetone carboxylase alpha subunit